MADYRIEDMPKSERPREKLEEKGARQLTSVELLSVILRTGTSGRNVKQISGDILREKELQKLADASIEELKSFEGISTVKASQIKAVGELSRRMKREERQKIEDLEDAVASFNDLKYLDHEVLRVVALNSGNELIAEKDYRGGVDKISVENRRLYEFLLKQSATAFVIGHNHPSGDNSPTEKDLRFTRELYEMGEKLGIELLDHLVIGKSYTSLRRTTEIFKRG